MACWRISTDLKQCALHLWESGWTLNDICHALNISLCSAYRWRRILDEHGTVTRPPNPVTGCARKITRTVLTAISELYEAEPDLYLDELCVWLAAEHDTFISPSALCRTLRSVGLTSKIIQKLAAECDDNARAEFQARCTFKFGFRGPGSAWRVWKGSWIASWSRWRRKSGSVTRRITTRNSYFPCDHFR